MYVLGSIDGSSVKILVQPRNGNRKVLEVSNTHKQNNGPVLQNSI